MIWILCAIGYGLFNGCYNLLKKQSVKTSTPFVSVVLFATSCLLLILWQIPDAFAASLPVIGLMSIKGIMIASSWLLSFYAVKKMHISKVVLIRNASLLISVLGGILIFHEQYSWLNLVGVGLVILAVTLTGLEKSASNESASLLPTIALLLAAIFNGCATLLDKYVSTLGPTSNQMQFWFIASMTVFLWIALAVVCIRQKQFIIKKHDLANISIYIAAVCLIVGDILMLRAYLTEGSKVAIISVLSKASIFIIFFGGIIFFKERPRLMRYVFLIMIFAGMVLSIL